MRAHAFVVGGFWLDSPPMGRLLLTLPLDFWDTRKVFWESALPPGFGPAGDFESAVANLPLQKCRQGV